MPQALVCTALLDNTQSYYKHIWTSMLLTGIMRRVNEDAKRE